MSDNGKKRNDGGKRTQKRNLPSWMSSRESLSGGKSHGKKPMDEENNREDTQTNISKGRNRKNGPSKESEQRRASIGPSSSTKEFCKLMEGVVFVLSGFVNPERSTLRSQALAMGAMFQADWNSDSTLLVCAFANTPKFRQVEADCGTIVSKEWISECYTQKKLVDIEQYIMHAGKPWRKSSSSQEAHQEKKESPPTKSQKQVEKKSESRGNASASSKNILSHIPAKEQFAPTEVKKWAVEDLTQTISWLESQEEKPVPGEIQRIAAEGILTCLQDAIDSLEQKQDVESVTEQWNFIPRVVKELMKVDASRNRTSGASKEELCRQAKAWKELYVDELRKPDDDDDKSSPGNKKQKTDEKGKTGRNGATPRDGSSGYDSDETVEMTEEEIELAYRNVALESC